LENFDADVHDRLRVNLSESREYLNKYDTMLWKLSRFELADAAEFDKSNLRFTLHSSANFGPSIPQGSYTLARNAENAYRFRIGHPLAQYLIEQAKNRSPETARIIFDYSAWAQTSNSLEHYKGKSGTLSLALLSINGSDAQDHLIFTAVTDGGGVLSEDSTRRLFDLPARVEANKKIKVPELLNKTAAQRKKIILDEIDRKQAIWFDEEIDKLNYWAEDKRKGLKAELKDYDDQIAVLKKEARLAGSLPDKLAIQKKLRDIDKKCDTAWKEYDEAAKKIEYQKDELLDTVEERLKQTIEEKTIFTVRWTLV